MRCASLVGSPQSGTCMAPSRPGIGTHFMSAAGSSVLPLIFIAAGRASFCAETSSGTRPRKRPEAKREKDWNLFIAETPGFVGVVDAGADARAALARVSPHVHAAACLRASPAPDRMAAP